MECFAGHLRKILLFLLVVCVCFYARSQFRGIICHPIGVVWSGPSPLFCWWLLLFGAFVWFSLCCFLFLFSFGPDLTVDYVMVPTPLLTPQCGTLQLHLYNSFISTTMCDDLARATEAQDGKKVFVLPPLFCPPLPVPAARLYCMCAWLLGSSLSFGAMLRKPATTTPKQFQTAWCFGKDGQHAGGARDLQSATVFPGILPFS